MTIVGQVYEEEVPIVVNVADPLSRNATTAPTRAAVRLDDIVLDYAELNAASSGFAAHLSERGVGPGGRVGLMLPNVPQFAVAYYGVLRLGAVVVPMNPLLKQREVTYYLQDSDASLIVADQTCATAAEEGASQAGVECLVLHADDITTHAAGASEPSAVSDREPDDTAVILYTSGTTGQPKGAELTHGNLLSNAESLAASDMLSLTEDDVVFGGLPLFHSFGQTCGLNAAIRVGACLTLLPRFEPSRVLEIMQRDHVTVFEGVPTMYGALLQHPDRDAFDVSSLRVCASGGAAMPVEVMRGFEEAFGCVVLEGYGLSETSPVASFNHVKRERKPGSIGTPISGVEMKLVDDNGQPVGDGEVGEIAIRGCNVMRGYWNRPEATAEAVVDGWFHTGDMARQDEDGYYYIVDRKKDLIIRGGYNVYPREIEEVLYEHPSVAEVAVIGTPHPELGEEIAAAVALKHGATTSPDELRDFVKEQVAPYKYPRTVWIESELPKGPTGKILKREITVPQATE